jgi:hypothetical protein
MDETGPEALYETTKNAQVGASQSLYYLNRCITTGPGCGRGPTQGVTEQAQRGFEFAVGDRRRLASRACSAAASAIWNSVTRTSPCTTCRRW